MTVTGQPPKITASVYVSGETGGSRALSVHDQVKTLLDEGTPVTVWQVAAKSGERNTEQASAILNGLATEGRLAAFRAGFENYYASPKVALTRHEPLLKAIISGSLKSLFLALRYKLMRKRREKTNVSQRSNPNDY